MIRTIFFIIITLVMVIASVVLKTQGNPYALATIMLAPGFGIVAYLCYEDFKQNKAFWAVVRLKNRYSSN